MRGMWSAVARAVPYGVLIVVLGAASACGDVVVPNSEDTNGSDLSTSDGSPDSGDASVPTTCEFGAADQCDDGNSCTVDECLSTNECKNTAKTGICKIQGECYDPGEESTISACWVCDPDKNVIDWSVKDCSSLDGTCVVGTCDINSGECKADPQVGEACDDGDACTTGDACAMNGTCTGTFDVTIEGCGCDTVADCDDGLDCTTDTCEAGLCVHTPVEGSCYIGGACYDDGATNPENMCHVCVPAETGTAWSPQLCDDGTPCTDESCDPEEGCVYVDNDAASCDDGDPCSEDDHCEGGACVGTCGCSTEADCEGDAGACQKWACIDYACQAVTDESLDGQACDDGKFCTEGELCSAGVCGGGSDTDCSAEGDGVCLVGQCNEDTDACEGVAAATGTSCDDGDACTEGDACNGSTCEGTAKDCTGLDDQCNIGECNAGTCEAVPQEGVSCTSTDVCVLNAACTADGQCKGTWDEVNCGCATDATCSGLTDTCNTGKCNASANQCYADPNVGAGCNDNNACTYDDQCTTDGGCAGTAYTCTAPLTCQASACDGNGGCDVTTLNGFCVIGGACYANGAENPSNPCQICDTSQSASAWSNASNTKICNADNNGCTVDDTCTGGVCVPGSAASCASDGKSCTDDVCQSLSSTGYTCNYPANGNGCHIGGACYSNGTANPSNPCQQCTTATNKTSWTAKSNGSSCNDDKYCTKNDSCQGGSCVGTDNPCDDGLTCTSNNCNESTDTCSYPTSSGCLIGGACYASGAKNPQMPCQACIPSKSDKAWSIIDTGCLISGTCYEEGQNSPDNCEFCDPGKSQTAWTYRPSGYVCQSGNQCTHDDTCNGSGTCKDNGYNDGAACFPKGGGKGACLKGVCLPSGGGNGVCCKTISGSCSWYKDAIICPPKTTSCICLQPK